MLEFVSKWPSLKRNGSDYCPDATQRNGAIVNAEFCRTGLLSKLKQLPICHQKLGEPEVDELNSINTYAFRRLYARKSVLSTSHSMGCTLAMRCTSFSGFTMQNSETSLWAHYLTKNVP